MTYDLYIAHQSYSSWSLRGWLMLEKFDLPYQSHLAGLYTGSFREDLAEVAPARTVPVMRSPEGGVLFDSLAMGETLAEAHPKAGLWPQNAQARALARSMVAEMHSGYTSLRSRCPMNLVLAYETPELDEGLEKDLERISQLWSLARDRFGGDGPWLFGAYSLADVFFAPVAARIMGYSLPVPDEARAYAMTHLTDPAFRRWRAFGAVHPVSPAPYPMDMPQIPWPGPQSSGAEALEAAPEQAPNCLVTGKEAAYFLRYQDETYGFASTDLRDAMCFDPEAFVQP